MVRVIKMNQVEHIVIQCLCIVFGTETRMPIVRVSSVWSNRSPLQVPLLVAVVISQ